MPYKNAPQEAKIVSLILRSQGIKECDPQVIPQTIEFFHKYALDILKDAQIYSKMKNFDEEVEKITARDIELAIKCKMDRYFKLPPSAEAISESAIKINSKPFKIVKDELLQLSSKNIKTPDNNKGLLGKQEYTLRK